MEEPGSKPHAKIAGENCGKVILTFSCKRTRRAVPCFWESSLLPPMNDTRRQTRARGAHPAGESVVAQPRLSWSQLYVRARMFARLELSLSRRRRGDETQILPPNRSN